MKLAIIVVAEEDAMFHIHDAHCSDLSRRQKYKPSEIHVMDADSPEALVAAEIEVYRKQGQVLTPDGTVR